MKRRSEGKKKKYSEYAQPAELFISEHGFEAVLFIPMNLNMRCSQDILQVHSAEQRRIQRSARHLLDEEGHPGAEGEGRDEGHRHPRGHLPRLSHAKLDRLRGSVHYFIIM